MIRTSTTVRAGAVGVGVLMLALVGTAAAAAVEGDDVDINVEITEREPEGVLALTIAANETTLSEVDSNDPLVREFAGQLPTVTVTDTRTDVPAAPWAVLATAGDFVSAGDSFSAEYLGWSPALLVDDDPAVEVGGDIASVVDDPNSQGLAYADGELLYANWDPSVPSTQGSWSATAGLHLKLDATTVVPGSYTSVLTLSLFQ